MGTNLVRWIVAIIVAIALVGLIAYARNDPGVGGRQPDPPSSAQSAAAIGDDHVS